MSAAERAQVGVSIDMGETWINIRFEGPVELGWSTGHTRVGLPSLESAEALRDALSAFIAFHKPHLARADDLK